MPNGTSYVDEFLAEARTDPLGLRSGREEDRNAVLDLIESQRRSGKDIETAFAALGEAQKPTKFDKIGDAALAVAAIGDLLTGRPSKRRESADKYLAYRGLRRGERKERGQDAERRFLSQMRLAEFTGDIAGRNVGLALGLSEQERKDMLTNLNAVISGKQAKAGIEASEAATARSRAETKKLTQEPTEEDKRNEALFKLHERASKSVEGQLGKYDPEVWASFQEYQAAYDALYFKEVQRLKRLYSRGEEVAADLSTREGAAALGIDIPLLPGRPGASGRRTTPQGRFLQDLMTKLGRAYYPGR